MRENPNQSCVLCAKDFTPENGGCKNDGCGVNNCDVCSNFGFMSSCYLCEKGLTLYTYN